MKSDYQINRWKMLLALLFLVGALFSAKTQAMNVDTELVILVDAQTFSQSDFDLILDGVAQSFESQSFIDDVAAGAEGRIAASVILFNSNNSQTVGIPWMALSSASDLQNFATSVRNLANPTPFGNVSYAGAISSGAAQIASSVYQGAVTQLTIIDDGTGFFSANPIATRAARDAALVSSVDIINGVIFDVAFQVGLAESYYNDNVVGGGPQGTIEAIGSPQGGPKSAAEIAAIETAIANQITFATSSTLSNVPEPSSLVLCLVGLGFLATRRR